jgi:MEDS: MEthanogen/methylotroph, DcmR Sensory domain
MSHARAKGGHFHAVRFYEDDTSLCRIVSAFMAEGIAAGQPAIVIATPAHNECILDNLRASGIDVAALEANNQLLTLDAREMLNLFMEDGLPHPGQFHDAVTAALQRVAGDRSKTIRAYGEMVDLLWKDGRSAASIKLEMLWNQLAGTHDFSLLCGYAMGNFYKDVTVDDVCRHHTHRVSDAGETLGMIN